MRERERASERAWVGEGQREGDKESEAGSRLWAVRTQPDVGLELMNSCLTNWAAQVPLIFLAKKIFIYFGESPSEGRAERGGQRIRSRLSADRLTAAILMWGSNSQTVRAWPEPKSDAQPTPGALEEKFFVPTFFKPFLWAVPARCNILIQWCLSSRTPFYIAFFSNSAHSFPVACSFSVILLGLECSHPGGILWFIFSWFSPKCTCLVLLL